MLTWLEDITKVKQHTVKHLERKLPVESSRKVLGSSTSIKVVVELALLNHDVDPWIEFLHPSEFLADLDWSADTPNLVMQIRENRSKHNYHKDTQLAIAGMKTGRAVALGVMLASLDGPLPVMDILGFTVATALSVRAWSEYFFS